MRGYLPLGNLSFHERLGMNPAVGMRVRSYAQQSRCR